MSKESAINNRVASSRFDTWALIISSLSTVLFTVLFIRPLSLDKGQNLLVLGEVWNGQNDVRIRPDSEFSWLKAKEGDTLAPGDLVFTGESSRAHLKVKTNKNIDQAQDILVESNTLIRLPQWSASKDESSDTTANQDTLVLEKGFIETSLQLGSAPLKVKINGETLMIHPTNTKQSKIQITKEKNNAQLTVLDGAIKIDKLDGETPKINKQYEIKNNQSLQFDGKKDSVSSFTATPNFPKYDHIMEWVKLIKNSMPEINFDITITTADGLSPGDPNKNPNWQFEISSDATFKNVIYKHTLHYQRERNGLTASYIPEKEGIYFWRIQTENYRSPIWKFTVINLIRPEAEWVYNEGFKEKRFVRSWQLKIRPQGPFAEEIKSEIKNIDNVKALKGTGTIYLEEEQLKNLPDSSLDLNISYKDSVTSSYKIQLPQLNANQIDIQEAPTFIFPQSGHIDYQVLDIKSKKPKPLPIIFNINSSRRNIVLRWKEDGSQKNNYNIYSNEGPILFAPSDFKKYELQCKSFTYREAISDVNELQKKLTENESILDSNFFSDWSEQISIQVKLMPKPTGSPANGSKLELERPYEKVTFTWSEGDKQSNAGEQIGPVQYHFEMDNDSDFSSPEIKREIGAQNFAKFPIEKPGIYFWRIRIITPGGKSHFGEPTRIEISPVPPPTAPEIEDMELNIKWRDVSAPIRPNNKKVWNNYWDAMLSLFISSAYSEDTKENSEENYKEMEPSLIEDNDKFVHLKLPKNPKAKIYHIQIFSSKTSDSMLKVIENNIQGELNSDIKELLIFEEQSNGPELLWQRPEMGTYFWRYSITDFWNRKAPFSKLAKLQVNYSHTDLKIPESKLQILDEDKKFIITVTEREKYQGRLARVVQIFAEIEGKNYSLGDFFWPKNRPEMDWSLGNLIEAKELLGLFENGQAQIKIEVRIGAASLKPHRWISPYSSLKKKGRNIFLKKTEPEATLGVQPPNEESNPKKQSENVPLIKEPIKNGTPPLLPYSLAFSPQQTSSTTESGNRKANIDGLLVRSFELAYRPRDLKWGDYRMQWKEGVIFNNQTYRELFVNHYNSQFAFSLAGMRFSPVLSLGQFQSAKNASSSAASISTTALMAGLRLFCVDIFLPFINDLSFEVSAGLGFSSGLRFRHSFQVWNNIFNAGLNVQYLSLKKSNDKISTTSIGPVIEWSF